MKQATPDKPRQVWWRASSPQGNSNLAKPLGERCNQLRMSLISTSILLVWIFCNRQCVNLWWITMCWYRTKLSCFSGDLPHICTISLTSQWSWALCCSWSLFPILSPGDVTEHSSQSCLAEGGLHSEQDCTAHLWQSTGPRANSYPAGCPAYKSFCIFTHSRLDILCGTSWALERPLTHVEVWILSKMNTHMLSICLRNCTIQGLGLTKGTSHKLKYSASVHDCPSLACYKYCLWHR